MNGNTDTVKDTGKTTRVSVFANSMTPGRVSKISKFVKPNNWFYTIDKYILLYFFANSLKNTFLTFSTLDISIFFTLGTVCIEF